MSRHRPHNAPSEAAEKPGHPPRAGRGYAGPVLHAAVGTNYCMVPAPWQIPLAAARVPRPAPLTPQGRRIAADGFPEPNRPRPINTPRERMAIFIRQRDGIPRPGTSTVPQAPQRCQTAHQPPVLSALLPPSQVGEGRSEIPFRGTPPRIPHFPAANLAFAKALDEGPGRYGRSRPSWPRPAVGRRPARP